MSERVLITVSGSIPEGLDDDIAAGRRPRADYRVLADRLGADVVDVYSALDACGRSGRLLRRLGGAGALLAWYCYRHRRSYGAVLTDGEQVGLPLALLMRLTPGAALRHVMIVHVLSTPTKRRLITWARLAGLIDRYVVYCSEQARVVEDELGVDASRIVLTPFMVDTAFFRPDASDVEPARMIFSAGLERRDYPTLIDAVDGMDVDVVITASSLWSRQGDLSSDRPIPENVSIERFDFHGLRAAYATSQFVVMPLFDVDFQAGITTILEAMSMGKAVVCTRTPGQTDTLVEGETGLYVPPGDVAALRSTIGRLLDDPDLAARLGDEARRWALAHADVDAYADRLAEVFDELVAAADG